jgi:hypothetical protein
MYIAYHVLVVVSRMVTAHVFVFVCVLPFFSFCHVTQKSLARPVDVRGPKTEEQVPTRALRRPTNERNLFARIQL